MVHRPSAAGSVLPGSGRRELAGAGLWALLGIALAVAGAFGDEVELVTGKTHQGTVVEETPEFVTLRVVRGGGSATTRFSVDQIRAVTVNGQRREVTAPVSASSGPGAQGSGTEGGHAAPGRTKAEVEALIGQFGKTPPEWWDAVPLEYPSTLDLTWAPPAGGWDPQRNLGQYMFSIVDANQSKWQSGAKLLHHVLTVNKDDPVKLRQTMLQLSHVYCDLLEDYARAAFWLSKADTIGQGLPVGSREKLAQCYWKLGSKPMAVEVLSQMTQFGFSAVKLWAEMGELEKALQLAELLARQAPDPAYLAVGDAYRYQGSYREAEAYYTKVVDLTQGSRALERNKKRAQASLLAIKAFDALDLNRIPDGAYQDQSLGYVGEVAVVVTVRAGRIESLKVTDQKENRALSALVAIPARIVAKQGLRGVDAVTGATMTSEAILNAAAKALAAATK